MHGKPELKPVEVTSVKRSKEMSGKNILMLIRGYLFSLPIARSLTDAILAHLLSVVVVASVKVN